MSVQRNEYGREIAATEGAEPSAASAEAATPPRVLVSGGEPLALGLMAFALGTLVVGMALVGVFPAAALGGVVPIVAGFCGIALFTSAWWSLLLGESLLAATFGTVSGFFFSLAMLLLGLFHNWYAIPVSAVPATEEIFYIVWCCFFIALLVPFLRFPAVYPLIVFVVITLLALAATAVFTGSPNVQTAAGAATLTASFLLFWAWLNVSMTAVGMPKVPPLGKVLAAPRDLPAPPQGQPVADCPLVTRDTGQPTGPAAECCQRRCICLAASHGLPFPDRRQMREVRERECRLRVHVNRRFCR